MSLKTYARYAESQYRDSDDKVLNYGGGYQYAMDDLSYLERVANYGVEGGIFYASSDLLADETIERISRVVASDKLIKPLSRMLVKARKTAIRQRDPILIYAIALAKSKGNPARADLLGAFNDIIRTGSDLLLFSSAYRKFGRSFERSVRRAISNWLRRLDSDYQIAKYRQRYGFSMESLARLAHPSVSGPVGNAIGFLVRGERPAHGSYMEGILAANSAESRDEVKRIILKYNLTWEMIPTRYLDRDMFIFLLDNERLPNHALLRNLRRIFSEYDHIIAEKVAYRISRMSNVHPGQILLAAANAYNVLPELVKDAINDRIQKNVAAPDERYSNSIALAIDVSGSMAYRSSSNVSNVLIASIVARSLVSRFDISNTVLYSSRAKEVNIYDIPLTVDGGEVGSAISRIFKHAFRGTNTGSALKLLASKKRNYDAVVIITDEQNWMGDDVARLADRLGQKLVVLSLAVSRGTITKPGNPNQLTVVGWTPEVDRVISSFISS